MMSSLQNTITVGCLYPNIILKFEKCCLFLILMKIIWHALRFAPFPKSKKLSFPRIIISDLCTYQALALILHLKYSCTKIILRVRDTQGAKG